MNTQKIKDRIEELKVEMQNRTLTLPFKQQIDFLQSLLAEMEPLDAPTHDGWWFVHGHTAPVYVDLYGGYGVVEIGGDEPRTRPLKDFIKDCPGQWLPANNPFGKGEG